MKKLSASLALLLLMNALMNSSAISAQTEKGIIRGKVIDKETQSSIPDAVIELIETEKKTGSDKNGEFVFENLKPAAYRIKVSYIGYETSLKTDLVLTGDRPLDI
ncbi:MAG: carboxypeptidase-like regulatory domain-containing protein, partial [Ignavibacteria bacterium]